MNKQNTHFCLTFLFLLFSTFSQAQILTIQGFVVDESTQKAIPYANVGFPKHSIGTSANELGEFILKISEKYAGDTLVLSSIGYLQHRLPLKNIKSNQIKTISLEKNDTKISEFEYKAPSTDKIMKLVRQKRIENYNSSPISLQVFHREATKELGSNRYFALSEGVLSVYKSPVNRANDAVRLIKGRAKKLNSTFVVGDTTYVVPPFIEGAFATIVLDVIKENNQFIAKHNQFKFKHIGYERIENRNTYVIHFEPKNHNIRPIIETDADYYQGKIYVDIENYTLIRADYEASPRGIRYENLIFKKKQTGLLLKSKQIIVNYAPFEGHWFIKSVIIENVYDYYKSFLEEFTQKEMSALEETSDPEKFIAFEAKDYLISISNKVESFVTQIDTANVSMIPEKMKLNPEVSFGKAINVFDNSFWGDYNIIKAVEASPDSLIVALEQEKKEVLAILEKVSDTQINASNVVFSNIGLRNAKKLAASQNKFILIDFYTDWCQPCKVMDKEAFQNPAIAELMNTFFINLKMNPEKGHKQEAEKYGVNSFPTILIIDSTGKIVNQIVGYGGQAHFKAQIERVLDNLTQGKLFLNVKESHLDDSKDYEKMLVYAKVRKKLGMSTENLTDFVVSNISTDSLNLSHYQQFLTQFAAELEGSTFDFFLKNKAQPIYANKLKKLVSQNIALAAEQKDKNLLARVLKANTRIINDPSVSEVENKRLEALYDEKTKQNRIGK